MFAIFEIGVYDSGESIYGCFDYGDFYCKFDDNNYRLIESDDDKNYLMNNHNSIHEMIHITDDFVKVIYNDRYGDAFVTMSIDPITFDHKKHMVMIDEIFDNDSNIFTKSYLHLSALSKSSYIVGAFG